MSKRTTLKILKRHSFLARCADGSLPVYGRFQDQGIPGSERLWSIGYHNTKTGEGAPVIGGIAFAAICWNVRYATADNVDAPSSEWSLSGHYPCEFAHTYMGGKRQIAPEYAGTATEFLAWRLYTPCREDAFTHYRGLEVYAPLVQTYLCLELARSSRSAIYEIPVYPLFANSRVGVHFKSLVVHLAENKHEVAVEDFLKNSVKI